MKHLYLILACLLLTSCYDPSSDIYKESEPKHVEETLTKERKFSVHNRNVFIIEIDSCEYVLDEYSGQIVGHHYNCRFCKTRTNKSIEFILKELKHK